jgi:hypothetical protein
MLLKSGSVVRVDTVAVRKRCANEHRLHRSSDVLDEH